MVRAGLYVLLLTLLLHPVAQAADHDLDQTKTAFRNGQYDRVIEQAGAAIDARERGEDWRLLHADALWMKGRYGEAEESIRKAQDLFFYSVRIRVLAHKIYQSAGDLEAAAEALEQINALGTSRRWGYREPIDLVALGQAAVKIGADPKLVLDNFYTPVKKSDPALKEVHLAIGNLALEKHDYALASRAFQEGLQKHADDPDLLYGMAEALAPSDREEMLKVITKVLEANENHVGARLLVAEHLIDAEEYEESEKELGRIESVNPHRPEMWAYRAVIAHLRNDMAREEESRKAGLKFWEKNPLVDHLVGKKLSQKYRFAEGSKYQQRALSFDLHYVPAQTQLAQDLLRLGDEEEGWRLAGLVARVDPYDVTAYNLTTLHDTMKKFVALTNENFVLRMSEEEAAIYGGQAMALLNRARASLTRKYGVELQRPTIVEIFPKQKDFAVRTFGIPGQEGYLGVCFGDVITANSPASHTMNWQAVLWHEFCHVVTLNLTRNKMPRWLSEGISVYEERMANPRWGERMIPAYREMILDGKMKPIKEMSSAFMAPPSGLHLQFAYYQSSLVVEFLIERFGLEPIRAILRDLGEGKEINEAIAARTAPLDTLEKEFQSFARNVVEQMGPKLNWEKPQRDDDGEIDRTWAGTHPNNYWVVNEQAEALLDEGKFKEAIPFLEKSIEVYPSQRGGFNAYARLAEIYRKLNDTEKEKAVLRFWVRHDDEPVDALLRLIELEPGRDRKRFAEDLLEVNPLTPEPYRALASVEEDGGDAGQAIQSYETVLRLNPPDPAEVHFRLARLHQGKDREQARKHVLLSLEEAPRYRDAHKLLLEIAKRDTADDKDAR